MAYITVDGVLKRYNPLWTMVGTGSQDVTTTDIASVYISDAESFVNAFLARRYVVPVQNEPVVTMLTGDIAIYKILEDRAPRIPEFAERRYTNAMSMLMMLADGTMTLTASGTLISSGGSDEAWSNVLVSTPIFEAPEVASLERVNSPWTFG